MNCKNCGLKIAPCDFEGECVHLKFRHVNSGQHYCHIFDLDDYRVAEPHKIQLIVRPEIADFALYMEHTLMANYGKTDWWQNIAIDELVNGITEKALGVIHVCRTSSDMELLKKEVAGVANLCMMIADNIDRKRRTK